MNRGWPLLGLSTLFGAAAIVTGVAGLSFPPLWLLALALAAGSYGCWSKARELILDGIYGRIGVEPNDDGTVGEAGARAERTATGRIEYEPRDDWDDPEDGPFDDAFWTDEDVVGSDTDDAPGAGAREPTGQQANGRGTTRGSQSNGAGAGIGSVTVMAPRTREACDVLGVDVDATPEEVRAAYRKRVKDAHPDLGGDETTFKRVRWAYEYLREQRDRGGK